MTGIVDRILDYTRQKEYVIPVDIYLRADSEEQAAEIAHKLVMEAFTLERVIGVVKTGKLEQV